MLLFLLAGVRGFIFLCAARFPASSSEQLASSVAPTANASAFADSAISSRAPSPACRCLPLRAHNTTSSLPRLPPSAAVAHCCGDALGGRVSRCLRRRRCLCGRTAGSGWRACCLLSFFGLFSSSFLSGRRRQAVLVVADFMLCYLSRASPPFVGQDCLNPRMQRSSAWTRLIRRDGQGRTTCSAAHGTALGRSLVHGLTFGSVQFAFVIVCSSGSLCVASSFSVPCLAAFPFTLLPLTHLSLHTPACTETASKQSAWRV